MFRPNVPIPERWLGGSLWHGTRSDAVGKQILEEGIIRPTRGGGRELTHPRAGRVYLATTPERALQYTYWSASPRGWAAAGGEGALGSRYGWLFEIDPHDVEDVEPDEDEVGYVLADCLGWYDARGRRHHMTDPPAGCDELVALALRHVAASRLDRVVDGEVAYQASVGKQLLPRLSKGALRAILEHAETKRREAANWNADSVPGTAVSVEGTVPIASAWRVDKELQVETFRAALEHAAERVA